MRSLLAVVVVALCAALHAQDRAHVVFVIGEREYGSEQTMPAFAKRLERQLDLRVTVLQSEDDRLPDLDALDTADLLVLYLRFRRASPEQFDRLQAWFDAGKPCVALRTTSHAFLDRKGWFPPFFGGHYKAHAPNGRGTQSVVYPSTAAHPIVRGLRASIEMGHGGTYNSQPLADTATPLLFGRTGNLPAEPIAWTNRYTPDSRIFYTSLGSRENFERDDFQRMLGNAVLWCLGHEVPDKGVFDGGSARAAFEPDSVAAPPASNAPSDATVLFAGQSPEAFRHWDPSVEPLAIGIDRRADSSSGGAVYDAARWQVDNGALVARPGFGDVVTRESFGDYHLHLDFLVPPEPAWMPENLRGHSGVYLEGRYEIQITAPHSGDGRFRCGAIYGLEAPDRVDAERPPGTWQSLDIHFRHLQDQLPLVSAWLNGVQIHDRVQLSERTTYGFRREAAGAHSVASGGGLRFAKSAAESFDFGSGEFTIAARFRTRRGGTIAAKAPARGKWQPDAKALFVRDGQLVYDIGWVGAMRSRERYADNKWHRVLLTHGDGKARMFVDGKLVAEREGFTAGDAPGHCFKIGAAAEDFGGAYQGGISNVTVFEHNVASAKAQQWTRGEVVDLGDAALQWRPKPKAIAAGDAEQGARIVVKGPVRLQADSSPVRFANVWLRPLGEVDHRELARPADFAAAVAAGRDLYQAACTQCHQQPGVAFAEGLQQGSDPLSIYRTLENGFGSKQPMAWIPPRARYALVHYLRDALGLPRVDEAYLQTLPAAMSDAAATAVQADPEWPPYRRMDYGNVLHWTYEVADDNIAQKAIAVRLDAGGGGVSCGSAFVAYDHDTMRVAAAWTGAGFIDWKGVAFDASHNSHSHLRGDVVFVNPVGPGWADPESGSFVDPRPLGRDGRPYGPLPRTWLQYRGRHQHGTRTVLEYTVGGARVLDSFALTEQVTTAFDRRLQVQGAAQPLALRVAPSSVSAVLLAAPGVPVRLVQEDGFHVVRIDARDRVAAFRIVVAATDQRVVQLEAALAKAPERSLAAWTNGGPAQWNREVTTTARIGKPAQPYAVDTFELPASNPFSSWMRLGGFDFFEDGKRAAVSTWNGDVWIVDGIDAVAAAGATGAPRLQWRRIAAGLYQPLGLVIVDGVIHVGCRDQICVLEDRNGDGETDFYRCLNNDHQVTEHFHEFAMGLQRDAQGNFYYAKSARHAKPALVPHHGTLLKVTADGSQTQIVANGFRAANGVCINGDGSFYVTDQEGHWTPKNRINRVVQGGFYGNMMGYHDRESSADEDMAQPLCWITNEFDRSPAELVRVASDRWGLPRGSLLQVSYGMGRVFVVLEDEVDGVHQGAMVALPIEPLPTGVMRGRFHPQSGQFFCCGLYGWSGARTRPGGFYRVRYTGGELPMPIRFEAIEGGLALHFGCDLDRELAEAQDSFGIKTWQLRRSGGYGSKHYDEKVLRIERAELSRNGRLVHLIIPDLAETMCFELRCNLESAAGQRVRSVLHGTLHAMR